MAETKLKQVQAISNPYKFKVSRETSVFTLTNSAQWYTMDWNNEEYDPNGDFDITTDDDYTVPVTGYYLLTFHIRWGNVTSGDRLYVRIANGGTAEARWDVDPQSADPYTMQGSVMVYLTEGDTITLDVQNTTSGGSSIANGTYATSFEGHLLSV